MAVDGGRQDNKSRAIALVKGIDNRREVLTPAFPAGVNQERFLRLAKDVVQRGVVTNCTSESVFDAITCAARDGLYFDGREAAIAVFKGEAVYMPMIQGLIKMAYRSGVIDLIEAHAVYNGDRFDYQLGDEPKIVHVPDYSGERSAKSLIGAYAIARMKSAGVARDFMARSEIDAIRALSRTGTGGPWANHYVEMARKTVLRRLIKRLPLSGVNDSDSLYVDGDSVFGDDPPSPLEPEAVAAGTPRRARAAMRAVNAGTAGDIVDVAPEPSEPLDPPFDAPGGEQL